MLKHLMRPFVPRNLITKNHNYAALTAPLRPNLKFANLRFLRSTVINLGKLFQESENLYAYSILKTIPISDKAIFTAKTPDRLIATQEDFNKFLSKNWRKENGSEIVQAFKDVVDFCALNGIAVSDPRFDNLVNGFLDHVEQITDEELSDLLKCLIKFPLCDSYEAHNFHDIWSALDDICLLRMKNWSVEKQFYFAELWYRLHLGRLSDYIFEFIDKLTKKASNFQLTKEQLVHTFFYLNIMRKRKVEFDFEYALERVIGEMSADEMAVVALGCFKTESKIKLLSIIDAMCRKIIAEHQTIHEITLSALLKILRFSNQLKSGEMLYAVLDHLIPEIERLSNLTCIHVALLGTNLQIFHKECLTKVVEKLFRDLDKPEKLRLKEIERLLLATTMFDFQSETHPDFYKRCLEEIKKERRRAERAKYSRCVPCALNYLTIRKIYDYELMNQVLDPDFFVITYGRNSLPRELMVLDYNIEIDCPDYNGNRLSMKNRAKVVKLTSERIPSNDRKQSVAEKLFLNVQNALNHLMGNADLVLPLHVLPHFSKADIILCKDLKTNTFVSPKMFDNYTVIDVKHPKRDANLKWYALIVLAYNQTLRDEPTPLGLMKMKARLLKAIGYEPIFISWYDFIPKSEEEKVNFLRNKLN